MVEDLTSVLINRRPRVGVRHASITESATTISAKIRDGTYTSEEVVAAHIAHTENVDEVINAVCVGRFAEALAEARAIDAHLSRLRGQPSSFEPESPDSESADSSGTTSPAGESPAGESPAVAALFRERPFIGVPCSVKECFQLKDMVCQSSGIRARAGLVGICDATIVARMRRAGFIPLHNTNTSEMCMWYESSNALHGRTCNPYDRRRIVGGSSGGEAAIVASCGAPCGIGSDIGGSIRMPAAFCGVWGHKVRAT